MGLFDALKKKITDSVEEPESVDQLAESAVAEKKEDGGGLFGGLKSGFSAAFKAVGIGGWKAKQVKDLQPNYTSENPLDHVLTLNN